MNNTFTSYWESAQQSLVGGVSSSFRINPFIDRPMYLSKADGPFIYDLDGNRFIDPFMGHGACTLGHNRPEITESMRKVFDIGFFAEFDHPLTGVSHLKPGEQIKVEIDPQGFLFFDKNTERRLDLS